MRADLPAAKAALDEATATAEPYGNVFVDGLIGTERARLLLADNDPPAAEELLVEVLTANSPPDFAQVSPTRSRHSARVHSQPRAARNNDTRRAN